MANSSQQNVAMEAAIKVLSSYAGRDKTMRTVGYAAMMLSGATDGKAARSLSTVSAQISATRVVLRLFDDLPMWGHAFKYGYGSHEKDQLTRVMSLIGNLSNVLFFPTEHLAWLAEHKILGINAAPWWKAGIVCWTISLVAGIIKGIRTISTLRYKRMKLLKQWKLESPEKGGASSATYSTAMAELTSLERMEYLVLIKNVTDFLNAVNWLPVGVLWAGRFNATQSGFFGTISSIVGMVILLKSSQ